MWSISSPWPNCWANRLTAPGIRHGLVDIVIGRLASGYGSDQYQLDHLRNDAPLFLAREGHPLIQQRVELAELLGFPWVLPAQPNIVRQQLEFAVQNMGLQFGSDVLSAQVSP